MNHFLHKRVEYEYLGGEGKTATDDISIFYNDYEVYESSSTRYYDPNNREPFYWVAYEMFDRPLPKEHNAVTFYSDVLTEKDFELCLSLAKERSEMSVGQIVGKVALSARQQVKCVQDYDLLKKLQECIVFKNVGECSEKDIVMRIEKLANQYLERGNTRWSNPQFFFGTRNLYQTILKDN
jgi:hypothetical protein